MKKLSFNFQSLKQISCIGGMSLLSQSSFASITDMTRNLQTAVLEVLAPMICVGGIIFSGFKLAMGDEAGKRMLFWSCVGTAITFTAPSLLSYLQHNVAA